MKNNASGSAGKKTFMIALIVANVLMLVAGILTIPRNLSRKEAKAEAAVAATPLPTAAEAVLKDTMPALIPVSPMPEPTPAPLEKVEALEIALKLCFEGEAASYSGVYTGELLDGLPHGQGSFASMDQDDDAFVYTGQWSAGNFEGDGKLEWENDDWYSGVFKNGLLNGTGQQYNNHVLVFDGVYENHLMASGKLNDNSGQPFYEGEFREGQRLEDAAALEARIAGYNKICVPFTVEVMKNFASYAGQIILIDCEVTKVTPNAFGTPELSFQSTLLDDGKQFNITWASYYCPVYGELLPEVEDGTLAFILAYEGPKGTYAQLLALAPYESQ
ncbi:hypothetical protein LJC42_08780 [Eubacteriales bacterium OttesenSCG-928-K08]|nr:hypothetical protein [Eubacteriales bacterium OttesenSCG-928-K08]